MGRKILCPSCNTTFDEDVLKVKNSEDECLVCGSSLSGDGSDGGSLDLGKIANGNAINEDDVVNEDDVEMWWYSIDSVEEFGENYPLFVNCVCKSCNGQNFISVDKFESSTKELVKLKEGVTVTCEDCGKEITYPIFTKRPSRPPTTDYLNIPKCPICNSTRIHKISLTNKAMSAVTFGVLAAGHVSKTYKCDTCGAKF